MGTCRFEVSKRKQGIMVKPGFLYKGIRFDVGGEPGISFLS